MQQRENTEDGGEQQQHAWTPYYPGHYQPWNWSTPQHHQQNRLGQQGSPVNTDQQQWAGWQQSMSPATNPIMLYSPYHSGGGGGGGGQYQHHLSQSSYVPSRPDLLRSSPQATGNTGGSRAWPYCALPQYDSYPSLQPYPDQSTPDDGSAYTPWMAGNGPMLDTSLQYPFGDFSSHPSANGFIPPTSQDGRDAAAGLTAQRHLPAILIWEKCIAEDVSSDRVDCLHNVRDYLSQCTEKLMSLEVTELQEYLSKSKSILPGALTPFGHPLMQLLIPPAAVRSIPPAVTDASLYCLRMPSDRNASKQWFRLSATGDPGFENSLKADWLIALTGFLYYALPPLRISVARHYCEDPVCWICELSFVFRSLDVSKREGRAQPVQISNFAEALFRAGPINALGLYETTVMAEPDSYRDMTRHMRSANVDLLHQENEESRVSLRIRPSLGLRSASPSWLRQGNTPLMHKMSAETDHLERELSNIQSRAQRRRNRVTRTVRRNEGEKRKAKSQEQHRHNLHYRCHQVVYYLLHSFWKLPSQSPNPLLDMTEDLNEFPELQTNAKATAKPSHHPDAQLNKQRPGALFSFNLETITECKKANTTKTTEVALLELDHSPWTFIRAKEVDTPSLDSNPISTSSSFVHSSSRPTSSSGMSSVSSASSTFDTRPFVRAASSPLTINDRVPNFCKLLLQSLWKSQTVSMVCSKCDKGGSKPHVVQHQVTSVPPVLSLKVKLNAGGSLPPLRFWRLQFPGSATPRTIYTHGLKPNIPSSGEDDTDMMRLISKFYKLRSEYLEEKDPVASNERLGRLKHLASILESACQGSVSPLPAAIHVGQKPTVDKDDENPWVVSEEPPRNMLVCDCNNQACDKCHRYDLICVLASVNYNWDRARKKLCWMTWTEDLIPRLGIHRQHIRKSLKKSSKHKSPSRPTYELSAAEKERLGQRIEAEEVMVEAPSDEDNLISYVRCSSMGPPKWLLLNGPVVAKTSLDEARTFTYPWKYPVAFFFARTNVIWDSSYLEILPPPPPPLPPIEKLFEAESISQVPVSHRQNPRFAPLSRAELDAINQGGVAVALDAEHVVLRMLDKSPTSILPPYAQLALGRLSVCRADGGSLDSLPFLDHYLHFRDEPQDYRTQFSGLYPGDLDVTGSTHWLATHKEIYQIMRYLVEKKCKFIGHDLFNDFRVIGIIVSQSQIIDTVEIYRPSISSRFLSLKFLCHHVLNIDIQGHTHDSIEDAQAALALYRYFISYVEKESLEKFQKERLNEIYTIGFQTQFKIIKATSDSIPATDMLNNRY